MRSTIPADEAARATDLIVKQTLQHAAAFYKRHASDPRVGATFGYFVRHPVAPINRKRLAAMLNVLGELSRRVGRSLRVLDLACGGGLIASAIAAQGHRVLGVDSSSDEVHLARSFVEEEHLNGWFLQADLLQDPDWERRAETSLAGKPDAVVFAYALHHLPRVEAFISRLSRWLPPGALLVVNEENPESPLFRLKHRVRTLIQRDTDTEWHRTLSGWKQMIESAGFDVSASSVGIDVLPGLSRVTPDLCWSLVFTASRKGS